MAQERVFVSERRRRPENFLEVLFGALGQGARSGQQAVLSGIEQKRTDTQQSFLNRLREESAGREQERLILAQKGFGLQEERFGLEREKFEQEPQITAAEQALIDFREAGTAERIRKTELLGAGGQQKIPLGSFIQSFLSGRQQIVPGTEKSLFPTTAPAPVTPGTVDTLRTLIQQLQGFGDEQVFPDTSGISSADFLPARDLDLAEAEGLARQWAQQNISDWANISENKRRLIIEQLLSEGRGANR